ncbi:MAG: transposase [DPANN group archaeon]|nr:transposase [DPANN group archaeon]
MSFIRKIKSGKSVYLAEVKSEWINGKSVQRHIRYIGKEVNEKTILTSSISYVEIEKVKIYGPLLLLNQIAESIDLKNFLGKYSKEILSLVYAHCLNYKSINSMQHWFEKTDLDKMLDIENISERKYLQALDYFENCDTQELQKQIFENTSKKYNLKSSGIIYDVTNTYLYGKCCPLGKYGHDKEGVKGRPLIQVALAVTKDEGIPILHKTFHGNIHDAKTLSNLVDSFLEQKISSKIIVFDRGITSKNTVFELKNSDWDVIGGLAIRKGLDKIIRDIIKKNNFLQFKNRIKINNNIFYVVSTPYQYGETSGVLLCCFNEERKRIAHESRYDEITYAQKLLKQKKPIKNGLENLFDDNGNIQMKVLENIEEFDGYSCIFCTNLRISNEDILSIYFGDKDIVEKAFQCLKGVVKLRPIRHWLYNRVIAHVFICYLAYLLLSLLKLKLKKIDISPIDALKEVETYYKVYLRETNKKLSFSKSVSLSKKQELIIKAVDSKLLKT